MKCLVGVHVSVIVVCLFPQSPPPTPPPNTSIPPNTTITIPPNTIPPNTTVTIPPNPPLGKVIWKMLALSGNDL